MLIPTGVNTMEDEIDYIKVLKLQGVYSFCFRCKRFKKMYAKNKCRYCYNYSKYKNKILECSKKWNKKNPNYFKVYYINNKKVNNE